MIFEVVSPILGFDDLKEVKLEKFDDFFMILRSTKDENISFTLIDPFTLRSYEFELPEQIQNALGSGEDGDFLTQNIVLMQNPIQDSIVNFAAPLVFNTKTKKVAQVILGWSDDYGVADKVSKYLAK
ncbi:MAG: flagellar assembly protein FliW [Sulfuricurvum sp.]